MAVPASSLSEQLASVVESLGPSVVRVEGRRRRPSSGIVYRPGVVVTAAHTLEEGRDFRVSLADGSEHAATLLGRDDGTDLAVLEVKGATSSATFSDGAGLKVGHLVLMLARPGLTVRATSGIVSALGARPWRARAGSEIDRYLESDAAHQPGFSGGPLVGLDGQVLGLNTSGLVSGTSLTVPTPTVRRVVEQLLSHGKLRRSYLGLRSQPVRLPEALARETGEEVALMVLGVEPQGPADQAGLRFGDAVLRLGGDDVRDLGDVKAFLHADHVGETVPVKVYRAGQLLDLNLTVGERP